MANGRAKKGGERGVNGEFYEGGKFLPSTTAPKRAPAARVRGQGLALVEPGKREIAPVGKRSIFSKINVFVVPQANGKIEIADQFDADHPAVAAYTNGWDDLTDLVTRYNAGERWYDAE